MINYNNFEKIKKIVYDKLVDKTESRSYEELSEDLFGEGNFYSSCEVRKRMYGMLRLIKILENAETVNNQTRILCISDCHCPFELPIETFNDYVGKVDILHLNGDIFDMQSISKFSKSYRIPVMEEILSGREYIINLINLIKPKKVIANYGNHELRFERFLSAKLENDLVELMPNTVLDLVFFEGVNRYDKRKNVKEYYEPLTKVFPNIEIEYTKNWWNKIGETIFCHPLAFKSVPMGTSEKAMQWFRNEGEIFTSLVMAHTHRVGEYTIGSTTLYEQGCCCDIKKCSYSGGRFVNSQKEGFLYLIQDDKGKVIKNASQLVCLN